MVRPPPLGAHFRHLVSSWRSWSLSWFILALLGHILSPSCSKMVPRWPNIAQHSAKMSQHSLPEQPQDPKKPSKMLYCRRFSRFRHFWQDRAQDPKKVAKMLSKVRQVGHLGFQVGHLGHILAPSWPTWHHFGTSWRQCDPIAIQMEPQMRSKSHLGPSWRQEGHRGPQKCPWSLNFQ